MNHICVNLSLEMRVRLLTAFMPVAHQLSCLSLELPELFTEVTRTSHTLLSLLTTVAICIQL